MKLEATKFRPREVIKHVLQTAAASLKKMLILEGHVADDVPIEVRYFSYLPKIVLALSHEKCLRVSPTCLWFRV